MHCLDMPWLDPPAYAPPYLLRIGGQLVAPAAVKASNRLYCGHFDRVSGFRTKRLQSVLNAFRYPSVCGVLSDRCSADCIVGLEVWSCDKKTSRAARGSIIVN